MASVAKSALVDAYLGALRDANPAALESVVAHDFTFALPQPALKFQPMQRADAIAFLTTGPGSFLDTPSMTFEKLNVAETDQDYVAEVRVSAKLNAGGTYDNLYVLWFRIADGKIKWCREHADTAYVQGITAGTGE